MQLCKFANFSRLTTPSIGERNDRCNPDSNRGKTSVRGIIIFDYVSGNSSEAYSLIKKVESELGPSLNLMGYIYFTTYTITTTGYGDIKPMTGYARFVVTLTNMFEVVFLVIFFNVLLSIQRPKNNREASQ
ncbi:hypothetical protein HYZ98_01960 [Candidatus Peregrinibacteria bacterium]|nr:hypothetical protein [Candidatus Peregrinibacteria bacterium]